MNVATKVTTTSTNLADLITALKETEKQIFQMLGGNILDYIFVFAPEQQLEIQNINLSENAKKVVSQYISHAQQILLNLNITPLIDSSQDLFIQFLHYSHEIYLLRFLQAKQLLAEYQLLRIPTTIEKQLVTQRSEYDTDQTFSLSLPATCYQTDDFGGLDIKRTIELENKTHKMAAIISTVTERQDLARHLLDDLNQVTLRGFVPMLYESQILEINLKLVDIWLRFFNELIYQYLDKGVGLQEATTNVYAFYLKNLTSVTQLPAELTKLQVTTVDLINSQLKQISSLNPQTIADLVQDYLELILLYIKEQRFTATNFYRLNFRFDDQLSDVEQRYDLVFDSYFINQADLLNVPIETYGIDLTQAAKELIFKSVTNDLVNPYFTLTDYLQS